MQYELLKEINQSLSTLFCLIKYTKENVQTFLSYLYIDFCPRTLSGLVGGVIVCLENILVNIIYIHSAERHIYGSQDAFIVRPHILSSTAPLVMYKNY